MKLNARCRQVPAASHGVPVSIVDQPHAVLPYVAVRRTHSSECSVLLLDGIVAVSGEADKQAQESVTLYYITRNAAEPHERCRGAGGTVRSFW